MHRLEVDGLTAHVTMNGSMSELLQAVAPYGVKDLCTHETDLADIFLAYYGKEASSDDADSSQSAVGPAAITSRVG